MSEPLNVLFMSQRNSARSILAEALMNHMGRGRFRAFSAAPWPARDVEPIVYELLDHARVPYRRGTPKHYRHFLESGAPQMDFVFTLSDTAAGEPPPGWPGMPVTAHWRCDDPSLASNAVERRLMLIRTRSELERRLRIFMVLPEASHQRMSLLHGGLRDPR